MVVLGLVRIGHSKLLYRFIERIGLSQVAGNPCELARSGVSALWTKRSAFICEYQISSAVISAYSRMCFR